MAHLILHIGHPKTGTTSLQSALALNRNRLAEHGVLYPDTGPCNKHFLTIPALLNTQTIPVKRCLENLSPDEILEYSCDLWEKIVNECEKAKPDQVILSAEGFGSGPQTIDNVASMRRKFSRICTSCEVVAYLRSPAARFLSRMNQRLRGFRSIPPIQSNYYRNSISNYAESNFDRIRLRIFDRSTLVNGDVVDDFCSVFLPDLKKPLEVEIVRCNETISAEAMALLQQLNTPDLFEGQDSPRLVRQNINKIVRQVDRKLDGFERPTLHEEVADAIVAKSRDLTWLRDKWGIVFPDVDYGLVGVEPQLNFTSLQKVSVFCQVNRDRLEDLRAEVMQLM